MASPLRPDPPEHHRPSHAADFARGDSLDRPVGRLPGPHQRWGTRRANPLAGLAPTGGCGWDVALVASGFLCVYLWVMIRRDGGSPLAEAGHVPVKGTVDIRRAIHDGYGAARDTDKFVVFIADAYVPDVCSTATMYGSGNSGKLPITFGPQVVGIDLQPKCHLLARIDVQRGAQRGHRFG